VASVPARLHYGYDDEAEQKLEIENTGKAV
jgi:hypothetical protein